MRYLLSYLCCALTVHSNALCSSVSIQSLFHEVSILLYGFFFWYNFYNFLQCITFLFVQPLIDGVLLFLDVQNQSWLLNVNPWTVVG